MYTRKIHKKQKRHNKKTKYNMRGCSSSHSMKKRKGGGSNLSNVYLAYPSNNVPSIPNPHLAYTGKGGENGTCSGNLKPVDAELPQNINAANPAYPNTGPVNTGFNFLNSQILRGGCGCSGGVATQNGGNGLPYGQGLPEMKGIPYPNGLVGKAWGAEPSQWPGVDGVSGGRDHLGYNNYIPDISREMRMPIASMPFYGGGKGKKTNKKHRKIQKSKSRSKKQKAGGLSNFMYQDLVNVGRQFTTGIQNSYNALNGYSPLPSPLPWKDQLTNAGMYEVHI